MSRFTVPVYCGAAEIMHTNSTFLARTLLKVDVDLWLGIITLYAFLFLESADACQYDYMQPFLQDSLV
jgi:hypothetical protein